MVNRTSSYERAVGLLPLRFRQEYGSEMVRIAHDLLDSAPDGLSRARVWMMLWLDLSWVILYQHINEKGRQIMSTGKKIGISVAWVAVSYIGFQLLQMIRLIGTEWVNTAGFLRVLFLLAFLIVCVGGPLLLSLLVWFERPRKLYTSL